MHIYIGEKPREEKEKRKEKELANVAREIFASQKHLTYIDLCDRIQQIMDVKERTAKNYIRYMREKEIIIKVLIQSELLHDRAYHLKPRIVMYISKDDFEAWMERIMYGFDEARIKPLIK